MMHGGVYTTPEHGQHRYGLEPASMGAYHPGPPPQPIHVYPPQVPSMEPRRPHLTVTVPHDPATSSFAFDYGQQATTPLQSHSAQLPPPTFYGNAYADGPSTSTGLNQDGSDSYQHTPVDGKGMYLNVAPPEWSATQPPSPQLPQGFVSAKRSPNRTTSGSASAGPTKGWSIGKRSGANANPAKVPRHQFTACGACRHRRVKCDLRARQEEAEREAQVEEARGSSSRTIRRRKVSCTNCQERGTNCVDEYAPLKAAKQLRRGKRISEIEMLYGKSAADAALASQGEDADRRPNSPTERKFERIPELTRDFFDSVFFRRFHIQHPIVDQQEFATRYISKPIPCTAAMGREGAVLCHCLYAWAVSYGVDERGQLDVPEAESLGPLSLLRPGDNESRRLADRRRRTEKTYRVVRTILREIDEYGILRKPSWDGVRVLLLVLPLTEGLSTAVERQAMYQATLSQVFMLCSGQGLGYDGLPASIPESLAKDDQERTELLRARIYSYAYVEESILSSLRGNTLLLGDSEDIIKVEEGIERYLGNASGGTVLTTAKMALAPIHFGRACRLIHTALTGQDARRRDTVNLEQLQSVWDALDQSWDEFDSVKHEVPSEPYMFPEEAVFFADGWKMCIFEALMVVRKALDDRFERLGERMGSLHSSVSRSGSASPVTSTDIAAEIERLKQLVSITNSKSEARLRQLMDILPQHLGSRFFEWDASSARDGLYSVGLVLAREGGTDDDIITCLRALNEGRWAFTRCMERSQEVRQAWMNARQRTQISPHRTPNTSDSLSVVPAHSLSESPFTSPTFESTFVVGQPSSSWPTSTSVPPSTRFSPAKMEVMTPQLANSFVVFPPNLPPSSGVVPQGDVGQQVGPLPPPQQPQLPNQSGVVYSPAPGQFVLQPDGSRLFVPYTSMP